MMKKILLSLLVLVFGIQGTLSASAASYDVYVDKDNETGIENGSVDHPYNTIAEGITAALTNDKDYRKVYIANGEYKEQITVGKYVKLYGKDKNRTIINGKNNKYAVKMKDHSALKNIRVYKGKTGILVDENAKASIKNSKIKKFKKIGIEILKSSRNDSEKVTVKDSKIYKGDGKGFYIKKGKIELVDNKVCDNDEEGIDIRSHVKGKIKNNEIYDNGESGIEVIVGEADLKISKNKIKNNDASAICAQFYSENSMLGDIKIEKNKLSKSGKYGIDCGNPSGGHYSLNYWNDSIFLSGNTYHDNKLGNHNAVCRF
ncbi:right-handed parallel beta-helix repeat-containing protein [bacterium]|nr:right-handed parallel beta-helix repeat-containing protein [bacterium]